MEIPGTTNEQRMLALFTRLRSLELDRSPHMFGDVSPAQMTLIEQIAQHPGCGVQDTADRLGLSAPTVSVSVARLEESGLVERRPNPSDRRSVQFFLTEQGKSLHAQFQNMRLRKIRRLLSGLNPQEQQEFLRLLSRALNMAEKRDEDPSA